MNEPENQLADYFAGPTPEPPPSLPPRVSELNDRLIRRGELRTRRRLATGIACLSSLCLLGVWLSRSRDVDERPLIGGREVASSDESAAAVSGRSLPNIDRPTTEPGFVVAADTPDKKATQNEPSTAFRPTQRLSGEPSIRVFATVGTPVPIFDVDEESQIVRHVGWVEERQTVPVDIERLSQSYRVLLEARLNEQERESTTQFISL